ncbi:helix-turn-helix domain-containing protein [Pseudogulbenkiania ferrooxidans]|uniref:Transcriptional regulator, XRE family n=1 Tax=Pseudogulbenkiania ferrooxidans 2002 TaxID=279714 RepID=B9Z725_9NEIS|nr:helix-turn-helix transcriptional regulator [Pseudogulbenkiania ferrooxidans]EEG07340.1 transcriptional regulator, XRE family [Pseudogulbenkiania ferrooxidans 2002]
MNRVSAFGRVVREARLAKGWSQEELAERASLHRNFVSLVERGQSKIALDSLFFLADALETTASELLRATESVVQNNKGNSP